MIKLAVIGDVVGAPGRRALEQAMPILRERGVDRVIANVENSANGSGLTPDLYQRFKAMGVDAMTLGDHCFKKSQIFATLDSATDLIRPANLAAQARGKGMMRVPLSQASNGESSLLVITLLGRLFMTQLPANDPYAEIDRLLEQHCRPADVVVVEIHAEATSEKIAMGWHLNGRAALVFGTHTHVTTADARLLPLPGSNDDATIPGQPRLGVAGGTAYITDLGMTGPVNSVLGRRADRVLKHMTTAMPAPFDVADGLPTVHGLIVDVNPTSGLSERVEPFVWELTEA